MTPDEYLALLTTRLAASYNVEAPKQFGDLRFPLYAKSQLVAGKYILHHSITYERIEANEHVFARVLTGPVSPAEVASFVEELKGLISELVRPSYDHMSSALTGVIVAEHGFTPEAVRKIARMNYTKHFWFGLQGWCFFRLLGIDLATGQVTANRHGKEVMGAYRPG